MCVSFCSFTFWVVWLHQKLNSTVCSHSEKHTSLTCHVVMTDTFSKLFSPVFIVQQSWHHYLLKFDKIMTSTRKRHFWDYCNKTNKQFSLWFLLAFPLVPSFSNFNIIFPNYLSSGSLVLFLSLTHEGCLRNPHSITQHGGDSQLLLFPLCGVAGNKNDGLHLSFSGPFKCLGDMLSCIRIRSQVFTLWLFADSILISL